MFLLGHETPKTPIFQTSVWWTCNQCLKRCNFNDFEQTIPNYSFLNVTWSAVNILYVPMPYIFMCILCTLFCCSFLSQKLPKVFERSRNTFPSLYLRLSCISSQHLSFNCDWCAWSSYQRDGKQGQPRQPISNNSSFMLAKWIFYSLFNLPLCLETDYNYLQLLNFSVFIQSFVTEQVSSLQTAKLWSKTPHDELTQQTAARLPTWPSWQFVGSLLVTVTLDKWSKTSRWLKWQFLKAFEIGPL